MPQQKFILSDRFELMENPEAPAEHRFTMYNKAMEESILLNEPIFVFLKNFEQPNTLEKVTALFAELTESSPEEVQPVVHDFRQQMMHRGVLLSHKKNRSNKNFEERNIILPDGHFIDEFCIEKHLSSNVPLHVYLADDSKKNKKVILKVLQFPKKMPDRARKHDLKLFEKEFHILRTLYHPRIAVLLDFRNDYAVIEYVEGEELYKKIKKEKEPNLSVRLTWLRQIFEAVAYLHKKNILHGDLHYSNVLISADNTAKLIDFDLACFADDPNTSIGGMRPFIPPERIDLNAFEFFKNLPDFRSEVHQLGVLTFFVVYGRVPFKETTWRETAETICNTVPVLSDTDNFSNTVPDVLKKLLDKSLQKNPAHRFDSCVEMLQHFPVI